MDTARIIALNLSAWMAAHPGRKTLQDVARASGVGFGTVRRAKNGDGNLTVANLESIAAAFHRTARELLELPAETTSYSSEEPSKVFCLQGPPPDETTLLLGYRAATSEVREIMLDMALRAIRKKAGAPPNHHSQ
jgi:transcriptional regulator with XRE-family HTH domain